MEKMTILFYRIANQMFFDKEAYIEMIEEHSMNIDRTYDILGLIKKSKITNQLKWKRGG